MIDLQDKPQMEYPQTFVTEAAVRIHMNRRPRVNFKPISINSQLILARGQTIDIDRQQLKLKRKYEFRRLCYQLKNAITAMHCTLYSTPFHFEIFSVTIIIQFELDHFIFYSVTLMNFFQFQLLFSSDRVILISIQLHF